MAAFELVVPIGAFANVGAAAERAHHLAVPPLLGDEIPALSVVVEMADKRINESKCCNESLIIQSSGIYSIIPES